MFFRHKISILTALLILYLSLTNAHTFDNVPVFNIPFYDKIVHVGLYFVLMSVIILEHRRALQSIKGLVIASIYPLVFGIFLELCQAEFTRTRSGDFFDALADLAGIFIAVIFWYLINKRRKLQSENN